MKILVKRCTSPHYLIALARGKITLQQMVCRILNETSSCNFVCLDDLIARGLDKEYGEPDADKRRAKSVEYPPEYDHTLEQPISELRIHPEFS